MIQNGSLSECFRRNRPLESFLQQIMYILRIIYICRIIVATKVGELLLDHLSTYLQTNLDFFTFNML